MVHFDMKHLIAEFKILYREPVTSGKNVYGVAKSRKQSGQLNARLNLVCQSEQKYHRQTHYLVE
uniref:Uncharacterized protein n=1 Tax=Anguilla anguilla TaxID=7936 RepID=A0A0E9VSM7_ANGAN